MKRTLLVIALLAALIPGALSAQSNITLDSLYKNVTYLASKVSSIDTDLDVIARDLLNVRGRLIALERQVAMQRQPQPQHTDPPQPHTEPPPSKSDHPPEQPNFQSKTQDTPGTHANVADPPNTCTVVSIINHPTSYAIRPHPQTTKIYREIFGTQLEQLVVKSVRYDPIDEILEIRHKAMIDLGDTPEIVEKWRGCKFVGMEFWTR